MHLQLSHSTHKTFLPIQPAQWHGLRWISTLFLLVFIQLAWAADEAAFVTSVTGQASAQGSDGTSRTLSKDAALFVGDTLFTGKGSAIRIRFTDGAHLTLRPNSRLAIDKYQFASNTPQNDAVVLNLVKGGLRTVTGLVGKRSSPSAYLTRTPAADIGIRGTDYALLICDEGDAACNAQLNAPGLGPALGQVEGVVPPGLYVVALEGIVVVYNRGGERTLTAVQAAYVANTSTAPVLLNRDPGLMNLFPDSPPMPGVDAATSPENSFSPATRATTPVFPRLPDWNSTFWDISSP